MGAFGIFAGTWQMKRSKWKADLMKKKARQLKGRPIDCPSGPLSEKQLDRYEFQPVIAQGELDFDSEIMIGPRSPPWKSSGDNLPPHWGGYIHTLMTLKDGSKVICNRGWALNRERDRATEEFEKDGTVKLVGVVRKPEINPWFMPEVNEKKHRDAWLVCEREAANRYWNLNLKEG